MDGSISANGQVDINISTGKAPQSSHVPVNSGTNGLKLNRRNLKTTREWNTAQPSSSSSSTSSSSTALARGASRTRNRGMRLVNKRRNTRFLVQRRTGDVEAIALPLGMSIAAVAAQVLEKMDAGEKTISAEHLASICTSAVRESLANVFGDKFELFARNFEKSFLSTLSTLRVIKNTSKEKAQQHPLRSCSSAKCIEKEELFSGAFIDRVGETEAAFDEDQLSFVDEIRKSEFASPRSSHDLLSPVGDLQGGQDTNSTVFRELSLYNRDMNLELACGPSNMMSYSSNWPALTTIEKSVIQQTRANDLKTVEIGLAMKKLRLKETELALASHSNFIERCKVSMGFSKASFKSEKLKTQLEETRHAELLRKCIDCLVAGLLLMSGCLFYGAYVYSFRRISDATNSCTPAAESKSWWVPKSVNGISSGLQTLRCQVQVLSRMLFGVFMILAVAYLLIQRSATPRHAMPITFILLLLGVGCGFAGKFCVDTLGGSGSTWLLYWEALCSVHLFANVFTSMLYYILHGPVNVSPGMKANTTTYFPYWIRRIVFYSALLVVIPLLSGLTPFATAVEWKDHISSLMWNALWVEDDKEL